MTQDYWSGRSGRTSMPPALAASLAGLAGFGSCTWLYGSVALSASDSWLHVFVRLPLLVVTLSISVGLVVTGLSYQRLASSAGRDRVDDIPRAAHKRDDGGRRARSPGTAALAVLLTICAGAGFLTGVVSALVGAGNGASGLKTLPTAIGGFAAGGAFGLVVAVPAAIIVYLLEERRERR